MTAKTQKIAIANGRLIAAAPDLLSACEDALELALAYNRITGKTGIKPKQNTIEKLALAIAKAKGR